MISQFVSPHDQKKLGELDFDFPAGTNAVGRLDMESEGLLILSTDKTLAKKLLLPGLQHERTYVVQVAQKVNAGTLNNLCSGIDILLKGKGAYTTQQCQVRLIDQPANLLNSDVIIHANASTSWLEFTLTEGKNRQIRKMCKAVGHRCLRLIRTGIEDLVLGNMKPGEVREIEKQYLFKQLQIHE
jgi:23S rRNA pseudouridine2457 synthase